MKVKRKKCWGIIPPKNVFTLSKPVWYLYIVYFCILHFTAPV